MSRKRLGLGRTVTHRRPVMHRRGRLFAFPPEHLEPRLLLAGDLDAEPIDEVPTSVVAWRGSDRLAVSGEWLIQLNPSQPNIKNLSAYLSRRQSDLQRDLDYRGAALGGSDLFEVSRPIGTSGTFLIEASDTLTQREVTAALRSVKGFRFAEPNFVFTVDQTIPNDPSFDQLWGMHNTGQTNGTVDADIDAVEAWDLATGSSDVVVAVIDTGVDYNHSDLSGNMWTNLGECPGGIGSCIPNGIDDDNNGYVDDFHGIDAAYNDTDPFDGQGARDPCGGHDRSRW